MRRCLLAVYDAVVISAVFGFGIWLAWALARVFVGACNGR